MLRLQHWFVPQKWQPWCVDSCLHTVDGLTLSDNAVHTRLFRAHNRGRLKALIKRVIAVDGDTVEIKDGALFINGEQQFEEYTFEVRKMPRRALLQARWYQ